MVLMIMPRGGQVIICIIIYLYIHIYGYDMVSS